MEFEHHTIRFRNGESKTMVFTRFYWFVQDKRLPAGWSFDIEPNKKLQIPHGPVSSTAVVTLGLWYGAPTGTTLQTEMDQIALVCQAPSLTWRDNGGIPEIQLQLQDLPQLYQIVSKLGRFYLQVNL